MQAPRTSRFVASLFLAWLLATASILFGQLPDFTPSDPPEYTPTDVPDFTPDFPFGDVVSPYLNAQPGSQSINTGESIQLRVDVADLGEVDYQWLKDGAEIAGATEPILDLPSVSKTDTGTYSVRITVGETSLVTSNAYFSVSSPSMGDGSLLNISTRGLVGSGESVMIGGFVISGTGPRTVAITAKGPSLAQFGVTNAISDPAITLYQGQEVIGTNDSYGDLDQVELDAINLAGLAPGDPSEPAMAVSLDPGAYTVRVTNNGTGDGVGLIEVFDWDIVTGNPDVSASRLLNISTRGIVGSGESVMIGGFVIDGNDPKTVAITARGPSLAQYGVLNPISDPSIILRRGQDIVAQNDDVVGLPSQNRDILAQGGILPGDTYEAALLVTIEPGAYTVELRNDGPTAGVAIIEVYDWDRAAP